MDLWHYQSNYSKDSKSTNFNISLFQAKHLVIIKEKDYGAKMAFSYLLQQNVSVELRMI